jgi:hypothetical protein
LVVEELAAVSSSDRLRWSFPVYESNVGFHGVKAASYH